MRGNRFRLGLVLCGLLLGCSGRPTSAVAMQIEPVVMADGDVVLGARGPVIKGDTDRLRHALASVAQDRHVIGLAIDSPGGNVVEGSVFASEIRARGLAVVVPTQSKCASVCFLIFAASTRRVAAADALIGVHSASDDGDETATSMAVTTAMARAAAGYGVPPVIIGKMVSTTPGRVEWLTMTDLTAMGVRIYGERDVSLGLKDAAPQTVATAEPALQPVPTHDASAERSDGRASAAVNEGRAARRAWEAWLAPLRGAYRDGAIFAVGQHFAATPIACDAVRLQPAAFVNGCNAARTILTPHEAQLARDQDFRFGWMNATASAQRQPDAAAVRADASPANAPPSNGSVTEFRGAMFCTGGASTLVLQLSEPDSSGPRPATLFFGPTPTNPSVPNGALKLEGVLDLRANTVALQPVSWLSQPRDWDMLGLVGTSGDGGRTFEGQVVKSRRCSSFTLRRRN